MTPPTLAPGTLRIIPLGGLGDVGRNMTCFEIDGEILLVDCGVLFPEDDHPGVDLILPGLDHLADRMDDIIGIVLTHGHEDHIGAVPHLLRRRSDIPVWGSTLTLALLEGKLREHRIRNTALEVITEGDRARIGNFDLEFFAVNHSIPDALAVFIRTVGGTVLHTGDFKMDQLPLEAAQQKLIVACFASHVHRVQQVMDLAVKHHRKVVYVGRSMVRTMGVARDLGYLRVPGDTLVELRDIENYRDDEVVIISTGSQGEPLSALSRIANHEHPVIEVAEGDTVLLVSSLIPGNENAVHRVINGLSRLGATVVHKGNALVHVSGHASAGELLYCYNVIRPRNAMPVHGEVRHLLANAALARATGMAEENVVVVEDGAVVDLADGKVRIAGQVDAGHIFVDGSTVGDITSDDLVDRKILGEEGFISVITAVDLAERTIVSGPGIHARGFIPADEHFEKLAEQVAEAVRATLAEGIDDTHRLQQVSRRVVGRWVATTLRRRPMIVPVVIAIWSRRSAPFDHGPVCPHGRPGAIIFGLPVSG